MTTLANFASKNPTKAAIFIAETGDKRTFAELHERSARIADYLARNLEQGEVIAILLGNRLEYFDVCFGARRAGLYFVPVSSHLTVGELEYILRDSDAKVLFTEARFNAIVGALPEDLKAAVRVLTVDCSESSGLSYQQVALEGGIPTLPDRAAGIDFAYSSGTTGKPKGIRHALTGDKELAVALQNGGWVSFFKLDEDSVYLSPAPLYHAAPLRFSMRCLTNGGMVVSMLKFDAERALSLIERYRVTHSQWVPTMFVRMLNLDPRIKASYDLSSHRYAVHAAAPCPVDIKRRMIEWWGPIVWEYYGGSERAGTTVISAADWLAHPGSVGPAVQGKVHILDGDWKECAPGEEGLVCFEGGPRFAYHKDPVKTADAYTPQGWATYGDIGRLDEDGYLYLTDRLANMIISGGVNIYPQEAENVLLEHPLVQDVAVIGVPNKDFGEEVKAVVELRDPQNASQETEALLIAYCRAQLSPIKCPRSVDFATVLPRTETGKLLKRLVRDQYRAAASFSG